MSDSTLNAADGLSLVMNDDAHWRIAWRQGSDWLGPVGFRLHGQAAKPVGLESFAGEDDLGAYEGVRVAWDEGSSIRTSVRAYGVRPLLVFRIEADADLEGLAADSFEQASVAWPWFQPARRTVGGLPAGTRGYGHHYSEFALPTFSDDELASFFLIPEPRRPAVVQPLWLNSPADGSLMLAPLDQFHEQIIGVPRGRERAEEGVGCGWHGDLASVPRGFATELAVWAGDRPRALLDGHASLLRRRHGTRRRSRYDDVAVSKLSYWTDNGAAYWYRTAPGMDLPTTLERTLDGLHSSQIPFAAVELDSWFYPHQNTRPVNLDGQTIVPPSGMLRWEARDDVIPEGVGGLRARLGDPPLILHSRHFSSASSYFPDLPAWVDGERAHPTGPELFDRFMSQAATWGAVQYEQDWLVESFLGVRGLRERPGRARAWQEGLDRAAGEHGLSLLWCMATPADFFQTLTLRNVNAIRTSGDYRYIIGNAALWVWFLHGNALARALGLHAFKDVFLSSLQGSGLDGDPCAEIEALLSALSAGPVGIGDRIGRSDRSLIGRTCRSDGILVKPDVAVAALDRCFLNHSHLVSEPLIGETHTTHGSARWHYVVSLHAWRGDDPIHSRVDLSDLGDLSPAEPVLCYDWRNGRCQTLAPGEGWPLELEPRDWDYRVLAPIFPGEISVIGDPEQYATAGDRRLRRVVATDAGVSFEAVGAPGERVRIAGWSRGALNCAGAESFERDADTGCWQLDCTIGSKGWEALALERA